jgi:hypothetical protein
MQKLITLITLGVLAASPLVVDGNLQDKDKKADPKDGKAVNGVVASAEVAEQKPVKEPPYFEVHFKLKNVSDKPITICDYVGNHPLKVEWIGPDGKTLKSDHYGWLRAARIASLSEKNFVTIPAGGVRRIGPQGDFVTTPTGEVRRINPKGEASGIIFQPTPEKPLRFGNVTTPGKHRVTVSYVNNEDGKKFNQQNVWTGTVTANDIILNVK